MLSHSLRLSARPWRTLALEAFRALNGRTIVLVGDSAKQEGVDDTPDWHAWAEQVHVVEPEAVAEWDGGVPIDLLVLDAGSVGMPRYKERNRAAFLAARAFLHGRSLVLIGDTDLDHGGKGEFVVEAAREDGWYIVCWGRETLLARHEAAAIVAAAEVRLGRPGPPTPEQASFDDAVRLHRAGSTFEAECLYRRVLAEQPRHAGALHLLGVVRLQRGDAEAAVQWIERAVAVDPTQGVFFGNLGAALLEADRPVEALACLHRALAIRPNQADALANLGRTQDRLGQAEAAQASFRAALAAAPAHADALQGLATLAARAGHTAEALRLYRRALERHPERPDLHRGLGNVLLGDTSDSRADEAAAAYERALEREPANGDTWALRANAVALQGDAAEARRCFERAAALQPDRPLWKLRAAAACPGVFGSREELSQWRERLAEALAACDSHGDPEELLRAGFAPPFELAYHGRNNRDLKQQFAAVVERHLDGFRPVRTLRPAPRSERTRVGFVVTRSHEGLFLRCLGGIIERLDGERFEPLVFAAPSGLAALRAGIPREGLAFVSLPERLVPAAECLAAAHCDVVYHWEVGTDALNYLLPFLVSRLAAADGETDVPVQCTSWGMQLTSGVPALDYYLSSDWIEPDNADAHYSERLWRMATLPTFQRRIPTPNSATLADFALPNDRALYVCPHNLLKMHPDLDELFGLVLRGDPGGLLVLKQGRFPRVAELLRARFDRTLPDVCDRIVFLPWQARADYHRLLSIADVVLDTLPFGAGSLAYDVFSQPVPIVTLPGEFNVGRYVSGCYRRMAFTELVATTADEFASLAHRVAHDREYRRWVVATLRERSGRLFEDDVAVEEHERFFAGITVEPKS